MTPGALDLVDEVRTLRAELVAVRDRVAVLEQACRRRGDAPPLLLAVAAAVAETAFSAGEVLQHARVVPSLRQALAAAGIRNPRQLGKWFRTLEGRDVGGVRLDRVGADRDGVVWRFVRV